MVVYRYSGAAEELKNERTVVYESGRLTATAWRTREPSERTRNKRSHPSSRISCTRFLRPSSELELGDANAALSAWDTTALLSQKILELEVFEATENGNDENMSREAWSWRYCGASNTGRNTLSVASVVTV